MILFFFNTKTNAISIKEDRVPGGIAILKIKAKFKQPTASFKNIRPLVGKIEEQKWKIFIPLPINLKPGLYKAIVKDKAKKIAIPFEVRTHTYKEQHIKIKKKKFVNPPKSVWKRIAKEKKNVRFILNSKNSLTEKPFNGFKWPLKGIITSEYGLKRFYNGIPKHPHQGIDIAAKKGSPIQAPANGKVLLAKNLYYNGLSIVLEHASQIKTLYSHLNKILVQTGQSIKFGDKIGEVGSTGRSTGPHLHWSVYLNGVALNPKNFMN